MRTSEQTKVLTRHSEAINMRLYDLQQHPHLHFTPKKLMATAAGLVNLDEAYHLEGIVMHLQHTQLDLVHRMNDAECCSEQRCQLIFRIKLLQDLANEFNWLATYGCRLY